MNKPILDSDIATLAHRAVLVSLNVRVWQGIKRDGQVSDEVAAIKHSQPNRGRFVKQLVSGKPYRALHNAGFAVRRVHGQYTFPWNTGIRILPKSQWLTYTEAMEVAKAEFDAAARELADALPTLKEAAKKELGSLYNEDDYPTPEGILEACGTTTTTLPLPETGDWRLELSDAATEALRGSIQEQVRTTFMDMNRDAFQRIMNSAQWVIETMEKDVKERGFGKHMLDKMTEVCENVEALGLNNPVLSDSICRVKGLLAQPEDSLRKDLGVRNDTRTQAKDILDTLKACFPS